MTAEEPRELGRITSADIFVNEGCLFCSIYFDFGGHGQGLGGYILDEPMRDTRGSLMRRRGTAYGMDYIMKVMKAVGVDKWSRIVGKEMWAIREKPNFGERIVAIEAPAYRKGGGLFDIRQHNEEWGIKE